MNELSEINEVNSHTKGTDICAKSHFKNSVKYWLELCPLEHILQVHVITHQIVDYSNTKHSDCILLSQVHSSILQDLDLSYTTHVRDSNNLFFKHK